MREMLARLLCMSNYTLARILSPLFHSAALQVTLFPNIFFHPAHALLRELGWGPCLMVSTTLWSCLTSERTDSTVWQLSLYCLPHPLNGNDLKIENVF